MYDCSSDTKQTYGALATSKLDALMDSLGLDASHRMRVHETFGKLSASFRDRAREPVSGWHSFITDDGSPFEISLEFSGATPTVRMLVEAWDAEMASHKGWRPAWELARRLGNESGVDLSALEAIADLYEPDHRVSAQFSLWHAAVVPPVGNPFYKVYLNPQVLGPANAPAIVRETLFRLGLEESWGRLQALLAEGAQQNQLVFVSLDLLPRSEARVKVYVGHRGMHMTQIDRQLSQFQGYETGQALWLSQALGTHDGPFDVRPPLSCLSFKSAAPSEPAVTVYFPALCHARDDAELLERLCRFYGPSRAAQLSNAVHAYAARDLDEGRGLMSWVSARRSAKADEPYSVVYLSPEAHRVLPRSEEAREVHTSGFVRRGTTHRSEPGMVRIQHLVDSRAGALKQHPLMRRLEVSSSLADVRVLAEHLSFFILNFQDVLRLVAEHASDPEIATLAAEHRDEDAGHELWYLDDARKLGVDPDARLLFSRGLSAVRDASYEITTAVRHATDDASRLAVVFALEAGAQLFFGRVVELLDRTEGAPALIYFGRHHQEVEQGHAVAEDAQQAYLQSLELTPEALEHAEATVDRVFAQMHRIADAVYDRLDDELPVGLTAS